MSKQYLLVAEVDKIQSFVFRSARRREVVGASFLLSEFCSAVEKKIEPRPLDALTSAGGSFRLVFDSFEKAQNAARNLERDYSREIGGSITIAPPVEYDPRDPLPSIALGNAALRNAKLAGREPTPVWHFPIQALCASCGDELAHGFARPFEDEGGRYICATCYQKAQTDWFRLFDGLIAELSKLRQVPRIRLPQDAAEADTYADGWDPRNYVSYLIADGNHMGKLFSCCRTVTALKQLSTAVTEVTTRALAEATAALIDHGPSGDTMPCLPLIMGGDDLFVLMPAPWAYHVSKLLCEEYETGMQAVIDSLYNEQALVDPQNPEEPPRATIGVAVIVCKANFPYKLAHQKGERLLEHIKDTIKRTPWNEQRSMLGVELIMGTDSVDGTFRSLPTPQLPEVVERFLAWRYDLNGISSRTLEQLRSDLAMGRSPRPLMKRVLQMSPQMHALLVGALEDLGVLGTLELLNHWDFTFDLFTSRESYAEVAQQL